MPIHWNLLDSIARLYGVSPARLQPVAGGHFSHVYETMDDQRACILRITPPNADVDPVSMRATLEWLACLSGQDGPVPRPVRSRNFNYSWAGLYIVTIVTHNRSGLFGQIEDGEMRLNEAGQIVRQEWGRLETTIPQRPIGCIHRNAQPYPRHPHDL